MKKEHTLSHKPQLGESAKKAHELTQENADLVPPEDEVAPRPTETEMITFVKEYYIRVKDNPEGKKHVLGQIRAKWGKGPFSQFGFGDFPNWSAEHGLHVYKETTFYKDSLVAH
eukprot:TRINITY_DN55068_c0_g1_i1.p2 TRINITY_DN55068_c0_g1~~TRINITY_DN55068_c0_g1_i1.p2  ORF type:complete len:114 (+),score=19.66 TRINITY_DN55068_c0_g1_i1:197-538(+)